MINVHFYYSEKILELMGFMRWNRRSQQLMTELAEATARSMQCMDDDGVSRPLDTNDISIPVLEVIRGKSDNLFIIQIYGDDYPNRLHDMADRLSSIAAAVRGHLETGPYAVDLGGGTIEASYIPIPVGGWVRV